MRKGIKKFMKGKNKKRKNVNVSNIELFLKNKKKKSENMVRRNIKILLKMTNNGWLSIEKILKILVRTYLKRDVQRVSVYSEASTKMIGLVYT